MLSPAGFLFGEAEFEAGEILAELFETIETIGAGIFLALFGWAGQAEGHRLDGETVALRAAHEPETPAPTKVVGRIEGDFRGAAGNRPYI